MAEGQPPLTWECSSRSDPSISETLPDEVVACLTNARFLHLATCQANIPHVSLMNYTYLHPNSRPPPNLSEPSQIPPGPIVIMTSNRSSKKAVNLRENPNVSLLVHDWVSSRPPNASGEGAAPYSMLQKMLMQMNSAEVSNISTTINGYARMLGHGTADEQWCKDQHVANNTFTDDPLVGRSAQRVRALSSSDIAPALLSSGAGGRDGAQVDGDDDDVRVFVVQIHGGRISDSKGSVQDWVIRTGGAEGGGEQPAHSQ